MSERAARRRRVKNAAPMIRVLEEAAGRRPQVTLESLLKHYERYGWDKKKHGYGKRRAWIDKTYRTYHQMRSDSLVEVARAYLDRDDYLALVGELGRPEFIEDAIDEEGWKDEHGEQRRTDVRTRGHGSKPTGSIGNGGHDGSDPTEVRGRRQNPGSTRIKGQVPSPFKTVIRGG